PADGGPWLRAGLSAFSPRSTDAPWVRAGTPPASLRWSGDASFHVVLDNTHYHGRPGQSLWTVSNAGAISAGLAEAGQGRLTFARDVNVEAGRAVHLGAHAVEPVVNSL